MLHRIRELGGGGLPIPVSQICIWRTHAGKHTLKFDITALKFPDIWSTVTKIDTVANQFRSVVIDIFLSRDSGPRHNAPVDALPMRFDLPSVEFVTFDYYSYESTPSHDGFIDSLISPFKFSDSLKYVKIQFREHSYGSTFRTSEFVYSHKSIEEVRMYFAQTTILDDSRMFDILSTCTHVKRLVFSGMINGRMVSKLAELVGKMPWLLEIRTHNAHSTDLVERRPLFLLGSGILEHKECRLQEIKIDGRDAFWNQTQFLGGTEVRVTPNITKVRIEFLWFDQWKKFCRYLRSPECHIATLKVDFDFDYGTWYDPDPIDCIAQCLSLRDVALYRTSNDLCALALLANMNLERIELLSWSVSPTTEASCNRVIEETKSKTLVHFVIANSSIDEGEEDFKLSPGAISVLAANKRAKDALLLGWSLVCATTAFCRANWDDPFRTSIIPLNRVLAGMVGMYSGDVVDNKTKLINTDAFMSTKLFISHVEPSSDVRMNSKKRRFGM